MVDHAPPEMVPDIWRAAWSYLEPAARRFDTPDQWDEERLFLALCDSTAQLWCAWDMIHERMIGAGITQIGIQDDMKVLEIPLVGGEQFRKWGPTFWQLVRQFGIDEHCEFAIGCGRRGWIRMFGFTDHGQLKDGRWLMTRPLMEH